MAGPTYGTSGSYFENDSSGPSFGAPSGVVADSVVVIAAYVDGTGDPGISLNAGWAHAPGSPVYEDDDPLDGTSQNHRIAVVWHRATGSEAGPFTPYTTSGSHFTSGQAHRFDGCKTSGDPFDAAVDVAGKTTSVTDSPSVAITTGGADELVLHAATNWAGGPWTPSSGFTERQDGGSFHHCFLGEKAQAAAGSTGSVVATATGNNKSQAWLGALLPADTADLGALAGTTAAPSGALTGNVLDAGALAGTTGAPSGALAGGVADLAVLAGTTGAPSGALAGTLTDAGALAGTTGAPTGGLAATLRVTGALAGTTGAPSGSLTDHVASSIVYPLHAGTATDNVTRRAAGTATDNVTRYAAGTVPQPNWPDFYLPTYPNDY